MIDYRFYQKKPPLKLSQIARVLALDLVFDDGGDISISGIAPLSEAQKIDIAYCDKSGENQIQTNAGACFVRQNDIDKLPKGVVGIIVANPRTSFSQIANHIVDLHPITADLGGGIIEDGANIHSTAIIADSASIGRGTIIGANCVIGIGVSIGRNCQIGPNCVVECSLIGDNVKIGANSVIGKAGFGVVAGANGPIDVPQFGRVIIQDNVTIGALCTVDKGAFGDTIIGLFTKIDNHCHIAHNVKIGRGVIMAAYAGISGSVEIGDFVMMGGRVGIGDHFKIGANAQIAAGSAVLSDVPNGEVFAGYPAKPRRKWMRELITIAKLAEEKKK